MPRRRTPTAEIQCQDRVIASGLVTALYALAERYPTAGLNAAGGIVEAFIQSSPTYPKLRHPSTHATPDAVAAWEEAVAQSVAATEADITAQRVFEHDTPVETD